MEASQAKQAADTFIDALHELESGSDDSGVETLAGLFSDSAEIVNTALLLGGETRRGADGVREFWREYKKTIGTGHSDFHHVTVSDDAVGLFWKTKVADGESVYDGSTLLTFDDSGKIRYLQGYYDTRQLNHAVGVNE